MFSQVWRNSKYENIKFEALSNIYAIVVIFVEFFEFFVVFWQLFSKTLMNL
jgi:hypothetical protein